LELDSPIRGGGFEAMKILHSYDVKGDKKSILKYNNIEDEYKNATGKYKIALELLKTNN
jgi:hypothetical protein